MKFTCCQWWSLRLLLDITGESEGRQVASTIKFHSYRLYCNRISLGIRYIFRSLIQKDNQRMTHIRPLRTSNHNNLILIAHAERQTGLSPAGGVLGLRCVIRRTCPPSTCRCTKSTRRPALDPNTCLAPDPNLRVLPHFQIAHSLTHSLTHSIVSSKLTNIHMFDCPVKQARKVDLKLCDSGLSSLKATVR